MRKSVKKSVLSFLLAAAMAFTGIAPTGTAVLSAYAAEAVTITSMDYDNGPTFEQSGTKQASFGFNMPKFNGGANTWEEVVSDLAVNVKVNGSWVDIDSVDSFVYNSNWGHWSDSGFNGYWFTVTETTYVQLYSKANPQVTLEYNLIFNKADKNAITALNPNGSDVISANRTGSGFIAFPYAIAGGSSYTSDADSLVVYVKKVSEPDSNYVNIDNNAASGWIYDQNFGVEQYGYWFTVADTGSINVKVCLKGNESVNHVYTITYADTVRDNTTLYPVGDTTITADATNGSCGLVLPRIGGTADENLPTSKELDNFVFKYYLQWNNSWVDFTDPTESGFFYQNSGYNDLSSKNQWGYFNDYVYGLWFQPVTEDFKLRVYYPVNGVKGGDLGNNYIEYTIVGAPNAYRPEDVVVDNITVDATGNNSNISGWTLYAGDEFNGTTLDTSKWNYVTGYYINTDEPGTAGWGNNELEYYTEDERNVYVNNGSLHLVAVKDTKTFTATDANHTQSTAQYASGKITSLGKIGFTYGRIDFRAKLPSGNGVWPALWMLPDNDTYGTWAASGEIDVMEARGRINNTVLGTLHYGGKWPNNKSVGGSYTFPEGTSYDDGYHVYSCIWEEDNITFYVDGNFYSYIPKDRWYSASSDSDTAPFDVNFYIVMNLAIGGNFDGGIAPGADFTSAEMLVDYVRVYKPEGTVTPGEGNPGSNTEDKPVVDEPVVDEPVVDEPVVDEPVVDEPVVDEPVVEPEKPFVPSAEQGVHLNADGTLTFYVVAENTDFKPMVFYGANVNEPALWKLAGAGMTKNEAYGPNYFSYTTDAKFSALDDISYIFSYTPLGTYGRIDGELVTLKAGDAKERFESSVTETPVEEEKPSEEEKPAEEVKPSEEEKPAEEVKPSETPVVSYNNEYGYNKNADGTVTFYIHANTEEMVPLVFWTFNNPDAKLWQMSGAVMERSDASDNLYTFTVNANNADSVSFMYGYTPVGEVGRRDSVITVSYLK